MPRPRKPVSPFRYFNSSPEVIRLVVMMYVRFPLSLRNVEDLLFERGIDICHETVRFWWNRFGPMFAADIRRQRVQAMRGTRHWRWHLDEAYALTSPQQEPRRSSLGASPFSGSADGPNAPIIPLHACRGDAEVGRRVPDDGAVPSLPRLTSAILTAFA